MRHTSHVKGKLDCVNRVGLNVSVELKSTRQICRKQKRARFTEAYFSFIKRWPERAQSDVLQAVNSLFHMSYVSDSHRFGIFDIQTITTSHAVAKDASLNILGHFSSHDTGAYIFPFESRKKLLKSNINICILNICLYIDICNADFSYFDFLFITFFLFIFASSFVLLESF